MVRIKKYGNRRLYDTEQSRYVNLEDLVGMIREGGEIEVVDAKTGADLTREVLLQVLMEVQGGQSLLPAGLLHRLVRYSGDGATTGLALRQLGAGLELLDAQIAQVERQIGWMARPPKPRPAPAKEAREPEPPPDEDEEPRARPERAAEKAPEKASDKPENPEKAEKAEKAEPQELDSLRARLAALESRLKR